MVVMILVIFLVLAGMALIWWGVQRLTLPEPIKTVILVVFGLLCLLLIYHFIVGGGLGKLTP